MCSLRERRSLCDAHVSREPHRLHAVFREGAWGLGQEGERWNARASVNSKDVTVALVAVEVAVVWI